MADLTQEQIEDFAGRLRFHRYLASVGSIILGPLRSAPRLEPDVEVREVTLYETGGEAQAGVLVRNNVRLILELEDMAAGLDVLGAFRQGDDVLAAAGSRVVTLVPITAETDAKTITFGNAFLQPGLSMELADDRNPHMVRLTYLCRPVGDTGKPFTVS